MSARSRVAGLASAVLALAPVAAAQAVWIERTPLVPSDGDHHQQFGIAAALLGDELFVGSRSADLGVGAVYVFGWDGREWTEDAKLSPGDPAPPQSFGRSLAVDGDTLAVGAPADSGQRGAVYVFVRAGGQWHQAAKLTALDGEAEDRLGWSVAVDGDTLAAGAMGDDDRAPQAGAVYVFARNGSSWTRQAKLTASDGQHVDELGWSVALDGDALVTGARWDDDGGTQSGAAYVFERSGASWSESAKLVASDAGSTDFFGHAVALDGDTLAVSAPRYGEPGKVYVFHPSPGGWIERAQLLASDATDQDAFGESLALDGDRLAVGGRLSDAAGTAAGAGYAFDRAGGSWTQTGLLTALDAVPGDQYGKSVALDGDRVVLGSWYAEPNGSQSGRAATFHFEEPFQPFCSGDGTAAPCPCGNVGRPAHGCGNSASPGGAALSASGRASVSAGGLVLHAGSLPAGRIALFLQGDEPHHSGLGQGFGDGLTCIATNVLAIELVHADAQGLVATSVDVVATGGAQPGDRKAYQLIYRDPVAGPCGAHFNLTNGLEVSFLP